MHFKFEPPKKMGGDCSTFWSWSNSIYFFSLSCAFCRLAKTVKVEQGKKEGEKKPSRTRTEQFAHDNMCDWLHHNGSCCFGDVSLVSSSHVSEQLMWGTGCNRSSCPGRAGAELQGVHSHDTHSRLQPRRENGKVSWVERTLRNSARIFFLLTFLSFSWNF